MTARRTLLPLALIAALAFALAGAPATLAYGGVHVDVGVGIPIGGHRAYRHRAVRSGYWTWRDERVWIPERVIGYDAYGHPVYRPGYYEVRRVRVWVPTRTYVRRHYVRPRGYVGFGVRFR